MAMESKASDHFHKNRDDLQQFLRAIIDRDKTKVVEIGVKAGLSSDAAGKAVSDPVVLSTIMAGMPSTMRW
jgi:hypothetical protein